MTADINYKDQTEPGSIPNKFFEDEVSETINDEQINTVDNKISDKISLQETEEDKFSDLEKIIKDEKVNINSEGYSATNKIDTNTTTDEEPTDYSALEAMEISAGPLTVADLLDDSISISKENLHVQNEVFEPEILNAPEILIDKQEETETEKN